MGSARRGQPISVDPQSDEWVPPQHDRRLQRWWVALVVVLASPIVLLMGGKGAENWCESQAMAAADSYSNKEMSVRLWPPGDRCSADVPDGSRFEAWWPIDW